MNRFVKTVALAAVAAAIVACGGGSTSRTKDQAAYMTCKAATQSALSSLQDLWTRLTVGMTLDSYTAKVGDLKVVDDHLTAASVSRRCEPVVSQITNSVDQFAAAVTAWNTCIQNGACSDPSVDTQPYWTSANMYLHIASSKLAALGGIKQQQQSSANVAGTVHDQDAAAGLLAITAQTVAETVATADAGSYASITDPSIIAAQDPGVNTMQNGTAYLSAAHGTSNSYSLTVKSTTGDTFSVRSDNGTITQTCAGTVSNVCKNGTW